MALNPRLEDWAGLRVWLVGASTGIGRATASALHARGARVAVSARGQAALDGFAAEHPGSMAIAFDATDATAVRDAAQRVTERWGGVDVMVYCAGHYRAMTADRFDLVEAVKHQQINYVGALNFLDAVLPIVLRQAADRQPVHLSLVASVAGYRGLPQAMAYGPTKAALINLAETLYLDLAPRGVGVSVINPGFVETPLTAQNEFRMPALITPEAAAQAMLAGWARGEFEIHFPKRFTRMMKALRWMPDALYFRAVRKAVHGQISAASPCAGSR
ncbi:MAG: SDR family NAD(P)-dependent oxidoreductase [Burkholderiales bacterium]|nr:SDR family NAD(P)-dependent oxidoreductase [Burkholderiales bacterium]